MHLSGLHLLLTYQCTFECNHCFVWGSPLQSGVMTLADIRLILQQASDLGSVRSIYFEGGEPFLYYSTLIKAVQIAAEQGYEVGIVTNSYWATGVEDALENLKPLAGLVTDLSVSSDLFHWSEPLSRQVQAACQAAETLGIPLGVISIAQPNTSGAGSAQGQLVSGESDVMYRGRAAVELSSKASHHSWKQFTRCPHEDLREPGRVHLDPLGNVQVCQGITLGNFFATPLAEICDRYHPDEHPINGPLLRGGPAELVRIYRLPHHDRYADACHLCYEARRMLRPQFPAILGPDQVYGVIAG